MSRTPGFIIPSSYSSKAELEDELQRRAEASGFTPLDDFHFEENVVKQSDAIPEESHDGSEGMTYFDSPEEALSHFGVLGMHWGVRRVRTAGVPASTDRQARKDAEEFARAKLFYGEGAGNRRKLIKATVEGKSKRDPNYKRAFENHLANQDMSEHAIKAQRERKRKNAVNSTTKTARGISHYLRGNSQYASAAAALIAGGALYAHKKGIDKIIFNAGKTTIRNLKNNPKAGQSASAFLRNMGIS